MQLTIQLTITCFVMQAPYCGITPMQAQFKHYLLVISVWKIQYER